MQAAWDASPELREDFARLGFRAPWAFLADFLLAEPETARLTLGADLNDDDRLPLEFSAPKSLYRDTAADELPHGARASARPSCRCWPGAAPSSSTRRARATTSAWPTCAKDMPAEAAAQLERAVASDPAHVPSLVALARALLRLDQPVRAIETLQAAARHDPRSAEAQAALARAWQAQRLTDRAADAAAAAVRLAPEDAGYRVLLAVAAGAAGQDRARPSSSTSPRASAGRVTSQLLESLAGAYARLGRGADSVDDAGVGARAAARRSGAAARGSVAPISPSTSQSRRRGCSPGPSPAPRSPPRPTPTSAWPGSAPATRWRHAALEHAVALDPAHAGAAQLLGEINAKLYGAGARASRAAYPPTSDEEAPMALTSRYLFSASMDVTPDRESLFHEVYDTEHVPLILTVPGVISATRFVGRPLTMMLGGERKTMVVEGAPRFHALYELDRPDVLLSDAWAKAVEQGRWPAQVRPHTSNRRHMLMERLG